MRFIGILKRQKPVIPLVRLSIHSSRNSAMNTFTYHTGRKPVVLVESSLKTGTLVTLKQTSLWFEVWEITSSPLTSPFSKRDTPCPTVKESNTIKKFVEDGTSSSIYSMTEGPSMVCNLVDVWSRSWHRCLQYLAGPITIRLNPILPKPTSTIFWYQGIGWHETSPHHATCQKCLYPMASTTTIALSTREGNRAAPKMAHLLLQKGFSQMQPSFRVPEEHKKPGNI